MLHVIILYTYILLSTDYILLSTHSCVLFVDSEEIDLKFDLKEFLIPTSAIPFHNKTVSL